MTKWSHLALPSLALLAAGLASGGCSPTSSENPNPPPVIQAPPPGNPGAPGGAGGPASGLRPLMKKIGGKPPEGLWPRIGSELNSPAPAWDDLQAQTKEFADLAANVGKNNPPKGSKESWDQQAHDFAAEAKDLNAAAQAKDVDKAKAVQMKVNTSCKECHMAHRGRPGG